MTSELLSVPIESPEAQRNERAAARRAPRRRSRCSDQLDFALPTALPSALPSPVHPARRRVVQRPCSRERAAWWFEQMRRAVDQGRDVPLGRVR